MLCICNWSSLLRKDNEQHSNSVMLHPPCFMVYPRQPPKQQHKLTPLLCEFGFSLVSLSLSLSLLYLFSTGTHHSFLHDILQRPERQKCLRTTVVFGIFPLLIFFSFIILPSRSIHPRKFLIIIKLATRFPFCLFLYFAPAV